MKHEVFFRADGNQQIGLGHLVRCSALASMLESDFRITLFTRDIPEDLQAEFEGSGFRCKKISHEEEFLDKLSGDSLVVVDGYHFNTAYQKRIKAIGSKLICIDDLHNMEFYADLVINHAPGVAPENYNAQYYTQYALGPEYALLRPSFLEQAKKERKIEKIQTVFICFGGSDSKNLTIKILKILVSLDKFEKIVIVTGPSYQSVDNLNKIINSENKIIDHHHAINDCKMLDIMLQAELCIVPSSGILMEALTTKSIVISGYYAKNQAIFYNQFKKLNCFIDAMDFSYQNTLNAINNIDITKNVIYKIGIKANELSFIINKIYHNVKNN